MPLPAIRYLTDFADQAVVLPLIFCVAAGLWFAGWRRGALVWCLGTGATLGLMLVLKLGFRACGPEIFGPDSLVSPSGHTAAAGAVYGTILGFINARLGGREASRLLIVLSVVGLIGGSRVLLGAHTPAEALFGAAIGFVAAHGILHFAGEPVARRSVAFSLAPLIVLPLLLHGVHLHAEEVIEAVAPSLLAVLDVPVSRTADEPAVSPLRSPAAAWPPFRQTGVARPRRPTSTPPQRSHLPA